MTAHRTAAIKTPPAEPQAPTRPSLLLRVVRWIVWPVVGLVVLLTLAYSTVAIAVAPTLPPALAKVLAVAWVAGAAALFVFVRPRRRAVLFWAVAFAGFFAWWWNVPATNDGDWQVDVCRPPRVVFDGDRVTIHDVRTFEWTGANEAIPRWEDRTYDLSKIESSWFAVSYWDGNRSVAHTMLSFGFEDGRCLALSVETRKVKGDEFSTWRGSFKQFALIYVLADERDVFRVRTNQRNEDLYLYPATGGTNERRRAILTSILCGAEELAVEPQWYMTLGRNCTTSLVRHLDIPADKPIPLGGLLLNGYSDELAYSRGSIPHDRPFVEVRAAHRVTDLVRSLPDGPDFSKRLREAMARR